MTPFPRSVSLQLDIDKIARARETLVHRPGPMRFLFERVREEIAQRLKESDQSYPSGLVVDFRNGYWDVGCLESMTSISLLESTEDGFCRLSQISKSSVHCLIINLQLSWFDVESVLSQCSRILCPDGVLLFSAFGPDTLGEVAEAWCQVDSFPHVHSFTDMHLIGDMLVRAGFAQPLLDTDWLTVEYPGVDLLLDDLKKEGFVNIQSERRKSLTGKNRLAAFKETLWQQYSRENKLLITFELIFGFARMPGERRAVRITPPVWNG